MVIPRSAAARDRLEQSNTLMRIQLLMLGKTRRPEMRSALDDYVKRISRSCPIETVEVRDAGAAIKKLNADRAATVVLLDAAGKSLDSNALAKWLAEVRDRGTRELIFLCGDTDGFPDTLRQRAHQKLSLSAMTFSHELARVMLAEQLYRAFAILSGSPYPK
jgi:23S rRNA (pseudouridine1915-N3)-methyltransferase